MREDAVQIIIRRVVPMTIINLIFNVPRIFATLGSATIYIAALRHKGDCEESHPTYGGVCAEAYSTSVYNNNI